MEMIEEDGNLYVRLNKEEFTKLARLYVREGEEVDNTIEAAKREYERVIGSGEWRITSA